MATKPEKVMSIPLRVLGYQEDGEWVAHCLETDLVGTGRTYPEAFESLKEMTTVQLSFSLFKGQPALFYHPAPTWVIEGYASTVQHLLSSLPAKAPEPCSRQVSAFDLPRTVSGGKFSLAGA